MSDEGLDKIFKKGLANRSVDFNMAAWRNMEQMLPPEPKAVFYTFIRVASLIGLLLLVGASSFYFWNTENSEESNHASIEIISSVEGQSDADKLESDIPDKNRSTSALAESVTSDQPETESKEPSSSDVSSSNNAKGNVLSANAGSNGQRSSSAVFKPKQTRNTVDGGLTSTNQKQGNSIISTKGNSLVEKVNPNLSYLETGMRTSREQELALSSNAFTKIEGLGELASISLTSEEDETIVIDVTNDGLPKVAKNVVGIIGGININQSLVNTDSKTEMVSEFAGITYQHYLNNGFSLKANLLYSARNGVNTSKLYQDRHYDFGGWTESVEIETKRLVYLELPVMVNYGVRNHNFMAGASFAYLLNSLSSVTTASTHPLESTKEEFTTWGYNKGFSSIDVSIVAGYEYSVTPNLNLGGRVNYGLIDVTDNNYFNSESFDNNIQFRVYVTYSPFQF